MCLKQLRYLSVTLKQDFQSKLTKGNTITNPLYFYSTLPTCFAVGAFGFNAYIPKINKKQ